MSKEGQKVSLMETLGARLLPEHEFRSILGSYFGRSELRDPKVVSYLRDDQVALRARYKDGDLIAVTRGPAFRAEDAHQIAARVRTVADETHECVQRCIVFSIQRTEGFWRFAERFQLLPAPEGAPDVPFALGPHPLVLEYKVRMSSDGTLRTLRTQDTETKLVLLLNAFMRFGLTRIGLHMNPHWVVEVFRLDPSDITPLRPFCATNGYVLPDFAVSAADFSATEHLPPIPVLADGEGYSGDASDPLQLSPWIETAISCYYALDEHDRKVFHRSLYWYSHGKAMYRVSESAALAAQVQAIEALAPPPGAVDRCAECGLDRAPGATRRFGTLLARVGIEKKTSDGLYKIRSAILHGSRVLLDDLESVFAGGMHPDSAAFWLNYDEAERAARWAMLVWLRDKVTAKATD
jgi:hypothetical protein